MNITEEMLELADNLTDDICHRIEVIKELLSDYGEYEYIIDVVLDLIIPGHVFYDLDAEQFVYDFKSTNVFCNYLKERQKERDIAKRARYCKRYYQCKIWKIRPFGSYLHRYRQL